MLCRGSVDETIEATWFGSDGAAVHMADTGTSAWDELRRFEQTCCARKMSKYSIYLFVDGH